MTVRYVYDGEFYVGRVLEVNGAIGFGRTISEMVDDVKLAVLAIRRAQDLYCPNLN